MFSSRNRRRLVAGLVVAGVTMAMAAPALSEALVVRSVGPSAKLYPPGRSLGDAATVTLKANDQLTLLDGRGTRTLKGPGTFNLASDATASAGATSRFAALVNARSTQRARIGAVRSMGMVAPHSPNIWYVDAARGGAMCVADPASVTLWRADTNAAATLKLAGAGGATASVAFGKGQSAAPWPASLPISNGAHYALSWSGNAQPSTIHFALLGGNTEGLEGTAAALIRNGCEAQLDLLVDVMSIPETGAAPRG